MQEIALPQNIGQHGEACLPHSYKLAETALEDVTKRCQITIEFFQLTEGLLRIEAKPPVKGMDAEREGRVIR